MLDRSVDLLRNIYYFWLQVELAMFQMGLLHNNKLYSQQAAHSFSCHVLQSNDDEEVVANPTDCSHINRGSLGISSPSAIVCISCFQERDF